MSSGISSSFVRDVNSSLVLSTIRQKGMVSRSELARETNLSYPTVSAIVKYFMDEGLVSDARVGKCHGGRRPRLIKFNPEARYVVGVSLRGSYAEAVLADLNGQFVSDIVINETPPPDEDVSANIIGAIEELQYQTGFSWDKVIGIGGSMRGSFDIPNRLYYYPDGPEPVHLLDQLEAKFPVPIILERNSTLGALSQYVHGLAKGVRNAVFINVDKGISAGLIVEGQMCRGSLGNAGEFGHVSVDSKGEVCRTCGRRGCLEGIASLPALVLSARKKGLIPSLGNDSTEDIEVIAQEARAGNPTARGLFDEAAWALSEGISDLVNIINPQLIILGGRVVWSYPELAELVDNLVKGKCWPYSRQNLCILSADPAEHSFLRGAVTLILEKVFLPAEVSVRTTPLREGSFSNRGLEAKTGGRNGD